MVTTRGKKRQRVMADLVHHTLGNPDFVHEIYGEHDWSVGVNWRNWRRGQGSVTQLGLRFFFCGPFHLIRSKPVPFLGAVCALRAIDEGRFPRVGFTSDAIRLSVWFCVREELEKVKDRLLHALGMHEPKVTRRAVARKRIRAHSGFGQRCRSTAPPSVVDRGPMVVV